MNKIIIFSIAMLTIKFYDIKVLRFSLIICSVRVM